MPRQGTEKERQSRKPRGSQRNRGGIARAEQEETRTLSPRTGQGRMVQPNDDMEQEGESRRRLSTQSREGRLSNRAPAGETSGRRATSQGRGKTKQAAQSEGATRRIAADQGGKRRASGRAGAQGEGSAQRMTRGQGRGKRSETKTQDGNAGPSQQGAAERRTSGRRKGRSNRAAQGA